LPTALFRQVFIGTPTLEVGSEIAGWVRSWGYEVEVASDGAQAVAALHRGRFAASFLDHQLGAVEGQTIWRVVRPIVGRRLILMARERSNELWFEALRSGVGTVLPLPPARQMVQAALAAVTAP
jgi:DNA-binding response OmpR family regulator